MTKVCKSLSRCAVSFDDLVGAGEQGGWHLKAEHARSLSVDDQLELRRLHDRQIGGLGTLEDAASIDANLSIGFREVRSVAHQAADFYILAPGIYRGNPVVSRELDELHTPPVEGRAGTDEKCILALESPEGGVDLATTACIQDPDLQVHRASGCFNISQRGVRL